MSKAYPGYAPASDQEGHVGLVTDHALGPPVEPNNINLKHIVGRQYRNLESLIKFYEGETLCVHKEGANYS